MTKNYWVWQTPGNRAFLITILSLVVLGSFLVATSSQPVVAVVFGVAVVIGVRGLGMGVLVTQEELVVRGMLMQRRVKHNRVVGLVSAATLDLVVPGGLRYQTPLRATLLRPSRRRLEFIRRRLAPPGAPALELITEERLRQVAHQGVEDGHLEALASERERIAPVLWWQWLFIALWAGVIVLGSFL